MKDKYCIVHERDSARRYWGYVVIAHPAAVQRNLHHSAAHFQSDGDICNEAAAIFEKTASKVLVVSGANRFAVIGNLTNECQHKTAMADAAHNNETMFYTMNLALHDASVGSKNPLFIEWHGMHEKSCGSISVFISAGLNHTAATYQDPSSPVNRLHRLQLKRSFNELSGGAAIPEAQSTCRLLGTTNIFGRYVNGVPAAEVCSQPVNGAVSYYDCVAEKNGCFNGKHLNHQLVCLCFSIFL
ncbi:unnamed protein product [Gongylonema pulchrum]|uniref:SCP domain-containing protein n=1 Tax=Gongylonema pulchrum TaxID=637853 RepID=A0A183D364_9BILA|nr:unnamed protein product [Gongylonema pulchrum]